MRKKLFISLALVATIAFATGPAAAQATPHYFKNAGLIPEGEKVEVIGWGTINLQTVLGGTASYECHNAAAGFAENPAGGGAGKGAVELFASYNCTFSACQTYPAVEAEKLPWAEELEEKVAEPENKRWRALFGNSTKEVRVNLQCWGTRKGAEAAAAGKTPGLGEGLLNENIFVTRAASTCCKHSQPLIVRGTSATHPGGFKFDAGSGKLEQEASGETIQGETSGETKGEGYAEQELITVHA